MAGASIGVVGQREQHSFPQPLGLEPSVEHVAHLCITLDAAHAALCKTPVWLIHRGYLAYAGVAQAEQMMQADADVLGPLLVFRRAEDPSAGLLGQHEGAWPHTPEHQADGYAVLLCQVELAVEPAHLGRLEGEARRTGQHGIVVVVLWFVPPRQHHHPPLAECQVSQTRYHHIVPVALLHADACCRIGRKEVRVQFHAQSVDGFAALCSHRTTDGIVRVRL